MLAGGELSLEDAYQKMLARTDSSLNMLKFSRNSISNCQLHGAWSRIRNDDDDTNRTVTVDTEFCPRLDTRRTRLTLMNNDPPGSARERAREIFGLVSCQMGPKCFSMLARPAASLEMLIGDACAGPRQPAPMLSEVLRRQPACL